MKPDTVSLNVLDFEAFMNSGEETLVSLIDTHLSSEQRTLMSSIDLEAEVADILETLKTEGLVSFGEQVDDSYAHQETQEE